ncbi:MAG: prolipoprotein diacylglyceryl transferase, partial [Clostridiales bacterium]|nr:prolipoprotein diacylglyceryl transferase [Candidatus Blautia equi]
MYNELLKIGPFTVYGYGLMIAIGILCAYILAEYRAKKKGMPYEEILNLALLCAAGGLLFAKLLYWITQWRQIAADPGFLMETMGFGFTVYGGVIGG